MTRNIFQDTCMNLVSSKSLKEAPTWLNLTIGLFLIVIVLYQVSSTVADPDLWGYLAFGKLFWSSGKFPYRDVFSYVPTLNPWVYHEWLTGIFFYPLYQNLGTTGLQIFKYLMALATFWLVYLTARKRGAYFFAFALVLVMAIGWIQLGYATVRAQVFTYFFFAFTLYLLENARLKNRWSGLWFVILIQVFWCNLHGGFLAGLGLISLYALGEFISGRSFIPYLWTLLLAALSTLINPYGIAYQNYILRAVSMPRPAIWEWMSIKQAYLIGVISWREILMLLCMLIFGLSLMWRNHWKDITATLTLCVTLCLGVLHIRHLIFFYLLMAAYFPVLINCYGEDLQSNPRVMGVLRSVGIIGPVVVITMMTAVIAFSFLKQSPLSINVPSKPGSGLYYPVGAVAYIQEHKLSGKLLTEEFHWGEYLLWNLYPWCKVALDGRYETVYPDEIAKKYFADFSQFLADYPPDMVLIGIRSNLYRMLKSDQRWREIYADAGCTLFIKGL